MFLFALFKSGFSEPRRLSRQQELLLGAIMRTDMKTVTSKIVSSTFAWSLAVAYCNLSSGLQMTLWLEVLGCIFVMSLTAFLLATSTAIHGVCDRKTTKSACQFLSTTKSHQEIRCERLDRHSVASKPDCEQLAAGQTDRCFPHFV